MINIKELAIGDWVSLGGIPVKVHSLFTAMNDPHDPAHFTVSVFNPADNTESGVRLPIIQGIPFSFEFMEKNGFKRVEGSSRWEWYLEDDDFRVVATGLGACSYLQYQRYIGDGDWNNIVTMSCYGVHSMQHFFTMTGIDKEIKL